MFSYYAGVLQICEWMISSSLTIKTHFNPVSSLTTHTGVHIKKYVGASYINIQMRKFLCLWLFLVYWAPLKKNPERNCYAHFSLPPFSLCCLSFLRSADNFNENPILTFLFTKSWMKTLNGIKFLWTFLFLFQRKIFIHNFNVNNVQLRFQLISKFVISYEVYLL
jgi:hypothetical protein